jgi:hypothetical protein
MATSRGETVILPECTVEERRAIRLVPDLPIGDAVGVGVPTYFGCWADNLVNRRCYGLGATSRRSWSLRLVAAMASFAMETARDVCFTAPMRLTTTSPRHSTAQ